MEAGTPLAIRGAHTISIFDSRAGIEGFFRNLAALR
jgi:hypothetical protein